MKALTQIVAQSSDYLEADLRKLFVSDLKRAPAAVCILFAGDDFSTAKILLTQRSNTIATHAGQVAFPGGSFEPEDQGQPEKTAFRECEEEVGVPRELPRFVGRLPQFPTMTGGFEVFPVIAYLENAAQVENLIFDPKEVSHGEWVSVQTLYQTRQYEERVVAGHTFHAPFFMWGERKMWGISAWIFDLILNRYDTIEA